MRSFIESVESWAGRLTKAQRAGFSEIMAAMSAHDLPREHRAYILATAWHETGGRMEPVREAFGSSDQDVIDRLDRAFAAGRLKWVKKPYWRRDLDGRSWYGRGYVQLTHKANYEKMSKRLGVDMVLIPDVALQPTVSAQILVVGMIEGLFTGRKLSDYKTYKGMRRVVNGTDRADDIAKLAERFERALFTYDHRPKPEARHAPFATPVKPAPAPAPKRTSLWSRFLAFLRRED